MARYSTLSVEDQARLEVAAQWRLRLESDDSAAAQTEFRRWLDQDADNQRAFEASSSALADLHALADAPELRALGQAARRRGRRRISPERWGRMAAALAVIAVMGAGGASLWLHVRGGASYVSARGQRRELRLADGSRVLMDANSRIEVRFAAGAREITLDRGRALFDVVHDPRRPFSVTAGDRTVVDVGTVFQVERLGRQVMVTVVRGRVMVRGADGSGRAAGPVAPVPLAAGQAISMGPARPTITQANIASSTAWETGQLVFDDEPLAAAVERVNRYAQPAIIVDPDVAATRISGMFRAGDTQAFVSSITGYFPIRASELPDGRVELARQDGPR